MGCGALGTVGGWGWLTDGGCALAVALFQGGCVGAWDGSKAAEWAPGLRHMVWYVGQADVGCTAVVIIVLGGQLG